MRDFYEILGMEKGLDRQAYEEKYAEMKAKYSEGMFLSGEEGNEAAKKLTELEAAWSMLSSDLDKQKINGEYGSDFGQVDMLIRDGRYDEAQTRLDLIMIRNAEWHYYQSVIFYKREWMAECRKHLVAAVSMEPENVRYKDALEKLDIKMANPGVPPEQFGNYQDARNNGGMCNDNQLSQCCLAYCCMECCCSMAQCC